jgi:enoyl-CoA hydratase
MNEASRHYTCFTVSEDDGVAELTLSRAKELNTMTPAFWNELPGLIGALDASGTTRALIMASSGRHFTAGMDLAVFKGGLLSTGDARAREQFRNTAIYLQEIFNRLERARYPVIAAVQGGCIGGGVDMVCAADLRYATRDAFFCIQEINIGMMADLGTLQRLPKLLPDAVVRELAYTGDRLSATEAHRLGFVNHLFESHDEMLAAARATARKIATKSPLAVAGSKEAITFARDYPVGVALRMTANWQAGMLDDAEVAAHVKSRDSTMPVPLAPLAPLTDTI